MDDQPPLPPVGIGKSICSINKATALMTALSPLYPLPAPTQDFEKGMTGTYHFCSSPKIRISLLSHPAVERYITNN